MEAPGWGAPGRNPGPVGRPPQVVKGWGPLVQLPQVVKGWGSRNLARGILSGFGLATPQVGNAKVSLALDGAHLPTEEEGRWAGLGIKV